MRIKLEREDILRILHDHNLGACRHFFLRADCRNLSALPHSLRRSAAQAGIQFFNLDFALLAPLEQAETLEQRADIVFEAMRRRDAFSITFHTSGSTGMPRNWTFSAFDLLEEAQSLSRFFASARRAVAVVPVHHVYGFAFALMLPKCLGIPAIHLHPLTTADFFRSLQAGDMIIAFPLFWASVLRMAQGGLKASLPENLRGVTSGAPCPPEVIEGLLGKEANAGTPFLTEMTEIYGATEFGAVGMRRDCRGKYTLLPHWRRAQTGTEITADGPAEWGICRAKGKVSPLPDLFDWKDERQFIPAGRKDKAVQVSSINVFPAQVAKVICAHPKVSDCAVRLMRPDEGDRLKAFVVPRDGVCMLDKRAERNFRQELKTWLAERLATAAIPKSISLGDSLPITATGKATDWPISQVSQS